jgi:hypothetical protein
MVGINQRYGRGKIEIEIRRILNGFMDKGIDFRIRMDLTFGIIFAYIRKYLTKEQTYDESAHAYLNIGADGCGCKCF